MELFDKKTVEELTKDIKINAKQKNAVSKWINLLSEERLKSEKTNNPLFQKVILNDVLNYPFEEIDFEKDNVEFSFKKDGKTKVIIETKGTKSDLFTAQFRNKKEHSTPEKQIWDYMNANPDSYGILTNYKIFVLYDYREGQRKKHIFDFEDIKGNPEKLKEFIGVFSKESLIDTNKTEEIKEKSIIAEREFTKEFYKLYHETRLMLIKEFEENTNINKDASVHFAQIFLNRLMFVFFAEDTGKVRSRIIEDKILKTLDNTHLFSSNSNNISNVLVGLFRDLDKGSDFPIKLFGFNGGLFRDPIPDRIHFNDFRNVSFFKDVYQNSKLKGKELELHENEKEIFEKYRNKLNPIIENVLLMASYDFNTEINVNILGHMFEQSISDIEELKVDKTSRRKKEGIFYTPEYITDYICRNTIIPHLSKKNVNSTIDLIKEYADNIGELEHKFKEMKILDPACGSGAFLIKATDIMLEIFKAIQEFKIQDRQYEAETGLKKNSNEGQITLTKWDEEEEAKGIIENNIYGVDINEESVEITKLSLFLKMARKNKKLTDLSNNIKLGNSLIDDEEVAGELAFDWNKEFPEIMENGGFDIIIGNPPYVNIANISDNKIRKYYQSNYKTVKNKSDLYSIFTEKATGLLKRNGLLSFIFSNSWLGTDSFSKFRKFLVEDVSVLKLIELPAGVFEDAIVTAIIIVISNSNAEINHKVKLLKFYENKFNKIKHNLSYDRIKRSESLTFSFEPEITFNAETIKLDKIVKFSLGIKTSNDKRFIFDEKRDSDCYNVLRGKDISKYYSGISNKWIWYKPKLMMEKTGAGPRHLKYFLKPKIFIQDVAKSIIACYDEDNNLSTDTLSLIYEINEEFNLKYILTLLNSNFVNKWFKNNFPEGLHIKINQLKQIPIPKISPIEQEPFINKAEKMLKLNKKFNEKKNKFFNRIKKSFNLEKINKKLDKFYELEFNYFVEEIEKQSKKKISLTEQDKWEDYFNNYKKEAFNLKEQIDRTDSEINEMVYKLYDITEEKK